ncbi:hypothetical protein PR202_ga10019 [Eleusine coracana subsp. coracana]|uniref:Uncharacterized protein n=1 Tax=Eleusine coracana subsp. coracana TaxID=191504 RepID=A0AAV5C5M5_ELECO|nr:hypothetical protein QOZ80_1AG0029760 [Eleusine coracana subsp. coracana]GJM93461.1 hypothetical protein PR202_ga10019 [Eleusine coracana subsp. coracana]
MLLLPGRAGGGLCTTRLDRAVQSGHDDKPARAGRRKAMTTRKQAAAARAQQQQRGGPAALKRGPWSPDEDELLRRSVEREGEGRWRTLPRRAGLQRCGKSCRLRWMNYLRPDIKRGPIAADEEDLILRLHRLLGNRWSLIAGRLPGRTDNEIKNYWNSHLSKKLLAKGIDPRTHKPLNAAHKFNSNSIAAAAAAADDTIKKLPVAIEPSSMSPPPLVAPPSSSSGAGGVAGDDGGASDFAAAMVGLDADGGFEGFGVGDEFRACWDTAAPPRGGGGDWGCPMVDDGTFSSFLDSLIDDDQLVHYFGGEHKDKC